MFTISTEGPALLNTALADGHKDIVEHLLADYFDEVAQESFSWLFDLKDAGFEAADMASLLLETTSTGPWIPLERSDFHPLEGEADVELHQPSCAHKKQSTDRNDPYSDPVALHLKRDDMQRRIAMFCGIAGVLPPANSLLEDSTQASFTTMKASILYDYERRESKVGNSQDAESGIVDADSFEDSTYISSSLNLPPGPSTFSGPSATAPTVFSRLSKVSTAPTLQSVRVPSKSFGLGRETSSKPNSRSLSQQKLVSQLHRAMQGLTSAAITLQRTGYCCNQFTILTACEQGLDPSGTVPVVRMNNVPFNLLKRFANEISSLELDGISESGLSRAVSASISIMDKLFQTSYPLPTIDHKLHLCSLTVQVLCLGLVLYSQGHTGKLHPIFLAEPLIEVTLQGSMINQRYIIAERQQLACMGSMIGDEVFVFKMNRSVPQIMPNTNERLHLSATCEDVVDSWGPAYLITDIDAPYGKILYGLGIRGGIIKRSRNLNDGQTLFHWGPEFNNSTSQPETFSYWEKILIGTINSNTTCPLDPGKSREESGSYLCSLGTAPDYWKLNEIQAILQAGYYVQLQGGAAMTKQSGIPLKQVLLDRWTREGNLSLFEEPWGVQVSLCTGVTRRVPLRSLIEEPLFRYIDNLNVDGWEALKTRATSASRRDHGFTEWAQKLNKDEKRCMQTIFGKLLNLLKDTGFDESGRYFSILWPQDSDARFCVKIRPEEDQLWCSMLKDSEWCATFAVATSLCLETPEHKCRKTTVAKWCGVKMLSTVVCPNFSGTIPSTIPTRYSEAQWQLENKKRYWIGKCGGEVFLVVRKLPSLVTELEVRRNRLPEPVASRLWRDRLMERPDTAFQGEEVFILQR
ncbi:hypothetical protein BKA59DRAFT_488822 [Fusarium tricinctum]|uniref:Uncharacterized protein n=1 Tax=Fusarium tricinctum TaxID=61284 RepID=A0A8K0RJ70_9HYPO|nr:hypothetical protein BKA59DRAFT_488822 [Fusarium tricinctum]